MSSFGFSIKRGQSEKFFGIGSLGGVRIVRQDLLHRVSSLIYLSQAISSPRQIVKDRQDHFGAGERLPAEGYKTT